MAALAFRHDYHHNLLTYAPVCGLNVQALYQLPTDHLRVVGVLPPAELICSIVDSSHTMYDEEYHMGLRYISFDMYMMIIFGYKLIWVGFLNTSQSPLSFFINVTFTHNNPEFSPIYIG